MYYRQFGPGSLQATLWKMLLKAASNTKGIYSFCSAENSDGSAANGGPQFPGSLVVSVSENQDGSVESTEAHIQALAPSLRNYC